MKYISVASAWTIYEVPDETFQVLSSGALTLPPHVVLEVMVMNGEAKRIGNVGTVTVGADMVEEDDDDELPEEGSPFDEDVT